MENIGENLNVIRNTLAKNGRAATLIAVSKQQEPAAIYAALALGCRDFGENKVQEAQAHWADIKPLYPDLRLHLIGSLQTNKVRDAVALFDVIHTVDRPRLAQALAAEMHKQGRQLPCFIQVNTGEEPQKGGVFPAELAALHALCVSLGLNIGGLMCIPPAQDSAVFHFGLLSVLAKRLKLPCLSMGMSDDYEAALRLGATHIRVGSALFGARGQAT